MKVYPRLRDDVKYEVYKNKPGDLLYKIVNYRGEKLYITPNVMSELLNSDGSRPLKNIPKKIMEDLEKKHMLEHGRFTGVGITKGLILFTICNIPDVLDRVCGVLNILLPILAICFFITGICVRSAVETPLFKSFNNYGYFLLIIASIIGHETGHLIAAIAYKNEGIKPYAAGILMVCKILPIGAFIGVKQSEFFINKKKRIQFYLAGIEVNFLLAGIMLIVSAGNPHDITYATVANINIILAITNLIPSSISDGEKILSTVLSVESVYNLGRQTIFSKMGWKELLEKNGYLGGCIIGALFIFVCFSMYLCIAFDIICLYCYL